MIHLLRVGALLFVCGVVGCGNTPPPGPPGPPPKTEVIKTKEGEETVTTVKD